jgi:hypothetical protein
MDMKKIMTAIIILLTLTLVIGLSWGKLFYKEYNPSEYPEELAKRDAKIEQLEDSIKKMRVKLELYDKAVKWFREANPEELQRGIEQIRSVPKDVPLP